MVSTNIAIHGGFFPRSLKSCFTDERWSGAGVIRSLVVAKVMKKNTTASIEKIPIVVW